MILQVIYVFFFFNDTATTEIYTLSLHDALPISSINFIESSFGRNNGPSSAGALGPMQFLPGTWDNYGQGDRKSTRLNSSHLVISYAVFCLKKKKYRQ